MPFSDLDATSVARSLAQIADRESDLADAFFERSETLEVPPAEESCGIRLWQGEGFAVRLMRDGSNWLAARDRIDTALFAEALRQVARFVPPATYTPPALRIRPVEAGAIAADLLEFPRQVTRAIRRRLAGFPLRLRVRRHRRWVRVVDTQMALDPESECYYSFEAETPWGRSGALLTSLDAATSESVATDLTALFRARDLVPVESLVGPIVLGPAATAVLLHEAVAHALEVDTLALEGSIDAVIGLRIGSEQLDVLDTPADGPEGLRRATDDEGSRVVRRWLLRAGVVEQPLADRLAAHRSSSLTAGAGRRSDCHVPPAPRSTHLELLAGSSSFEQLLQIAGNGYFFPMASRGTLDPLTGRFELDLVAGRRVVSGSLDEPIGTGSLVGTVSDLLSSIQAVGSDRRTAGAGWCAKGGVRLPVWSTAPAVLLELGEGGS